jgi:hypothetical protein
MSFARRSILPSILAQLIGHIPLRGQYRGSLRAARSKAEHARRIEAAQGKRERRCARNLANAQLRSA